MPMIGIRELMFVNIVIYNSLKPGNGFGFKLPDQLQDGVVRNLAAARAKFTIVGRV